MAKAMRWMIAATVAVSVYCGGAASARPLNPKQLSFLKEQAIPAYQQGVVGLLLERLAKFASGTDEQGVAQADVLLRENDAPQLAHLLLAARMAKVQQGGKFLDPRPNPNEALLLSSYLDQQIASLAAGVEALPALSEVPPRPERLTGYETHFWDLDQANGDLSVAQFLAQEAIKLQGLFPPSRRTAPDEQARKTFEAGFKAALAKLTGLRRQVSERALRLRLQRLQDSVAVLEDSKDLTSRWRAAYFVDSDGALLAQFFRKPVTNGTEPKRAVGRPLPSSQLAKNENGKETDAESVRPAPVRFRDPVLNDPQLAAKIEQYVQDGLKAAGELTAKTRMLYTGLTWWLRGRYGRGPQFMGLIKSPAALDSPAALFAVGMPSSLPVAADPSDSSKPRSPAVLRRHHQTWAWEERTLQVKSLYVHEEAGGGASPVTGFLTTVKGIAAHGDFSFFRDELGEWSGTFYMGEGRSMYGMRQSDMTRFGGVGEPFKNIEDRIYDRTTTFTKTYLPSERADIVKRIVGFIEYAQALDYFDRLLAMTNADEQKVIDELIAEDDRFTVYTNLSRLVQQRPSTLAEAPTEPQDKFERRGFGWVTGLARVELAAMLSAFAYRDNAFSLVMRNRFGAAEYKELIQDGMRTHLASLQRDPYVRQTLSDSAPVNRMLAYLRRVSLAKAFVQAAASVSGNEYTPAQWSELKPWLDNLTGMQATLIVNIQSRLATTKDVQQRKWYEGFLGQAKIEKSVSNELQRRGYNPNQILKK